MELVCTINEKGKMTEAGVETIFEMETVVRYSCPDAMSPHVAGAHLVALVGTVYPTVEDAEDEGKF